MLPQTSYLANAQVIDDVEYESHETKACSGLHVGVALHLPMICRQVAWTNPYKTNVGKLRVSQGSWMAA